MSTIQDKSIRTRLFGINLATSDSSRITDIVPLQTVIEFGRLESIQSEQELFVASEAVVVDKEENKAAMELADVAIAEAVEEYVVLNHFVQGEVVPIRQKDIVALGPQEVRRRKNFAAINFAIYPSRLQQLGRTKTVSYLRDVVNACADGEYVSQDAVAPLKAKVAAAEVAVNALKDEELDDAPLFNALYQAREKAIRTYQAFRSIVSGALQFSQSPHTLDQFILKEVKNKAPEKSEEIEWVLAEDAAAATEAGAAVVPTVPIPATPQ